VLLAAAAGAGGAPGAAGRTGSAAATLAVGGTTRSTCPTSRTFGFSRLFQRWMSRQFWPVSSAMRTSVSPRCTV
jgi:hypothetical protein